MERFNPARNLPHLTIILKKGEIMMQDALHILIELEREREMNGGGNNMAVFFDQLS